MLTSQQFGSTKQLCDKIISLTYYVLPPPFLLSFFSFKVPAPATVQRGLELLLQIGIDVLGGARGGCRARELSTIAQTSAKLGLLLLSVARVNDFFTKLLLSLTQHAAEMDSQGLANALHALATLSRLDGAADVGLDQWTLQPAVQALSAAVYVQ